MMISSYEEFCQAIDQMGFLYFGGWSGGDGIPSLNTLTRHGVWHTGDDAVDPWAWKSRYAGERHGAYGAMLGRGQGFIAPRLYASFYALRRPEQDRATMYRQGLLPGAENIIWQAIDSYGMMDKSQLHALARSEGISHSMCDGALRRLEMRFVIAVTGATRRRNQKTGEPYGWSINIYEPTRPYMDDFLTEIPPREQAMENILACARAQAGHIDDLRWKKILYLDT